MFQEQADMTFTRVDTPDGEILISSRAEVLESDSDRATRELMEEGARNRRADPMSLDSDNPMNLDLPEGPQPRVRNRTHEAGTRVMEGDVEVNDTNIHPWFSGWEEYDDDAGRVGVATGDGRAGLWETSDGNIRVGASGRLELFGAEGEDDSGSGAELQGLGLTGDAWFGSEGFNLGGGATALGGATSTGRSDPNSSGDDHIRYGGGAGSGFGIRGHWGDSDEDGAAELGFGFDAGPITLDVTSEDWAGAPGRLWDRATGSEP